MNHGPGKVGTSHGAVVAQVSAGAGCTLSTGQDVVQGAGRGGAWSAVPYAEHMT